MRPMQIDFATGNWRSTLYRVHPAFLAAGVLGLGLLLAGGAFGVQATKQQAAREESLRAQQRKQAAAVRAPAKSRKPSFRKRRPWPSTPPSCN